MALFARSRNHAREVELERRVNALQGALNQCKGVARQWWGFRVRFTIGVAVIAMAIGFTLGVYRHAIKEAFVETAAAVGLASPPGDAAAEAEAAFQKGDYTKALKLARPLADEGNPRAEAVVGLAYYRGRGARHRARSGWSSARRCRNRRHSHGGDGGGPRHWRPRTPPAPPQAARALSPWTAAPVGTSRLPTRKAGFGFAAHTRPRASASS